MTEAGKAGPGAAGHLQAEVSALLQALGEPEVAPSGPGCVVALQGETLCMPYRLTCSENALWRLIEASTGPRRLLALGLGTRHTDGRVREACLREVLRADEAWLLPFVLRLLGEYVIEIVEAIALALPSLNAAHLAAFVQQNPAFMATTRRRATSYWSCYHRGRYPRLADSPAIRALNALETLRQAA